MVVELLLSDHCIHVQVTSAENRRLSHYNNVSICTRPASKHFGQSPSESPRLASATGSPASEDDDADRTTSIKILLQMYNKPQTHQQPTTHLTTYKMPDQPPKPKANDATTTDYDLTQPLQTGTGLRQNLTSYGDAHFSLFLRKVFIKALGYSDDALSRPIVGIVNTYSGFNPCHGNVPQLIEAVKRGVHLNGGLAVDFPTISVHESFATPTSMYLRNLMSMDTEEMIKAQPVDSVVLIGGE